MITLKNFAEEKGLSLEQAKKLTGLTHWKQGVVDPSVYDRIPIIDPVSNKVIEPNGTDNNELLKQAIALQECIGQKTPAYLAFVNNNKEKLPNEYELVKHNIKRYICKNG